MTHADPCLICIVHPPTARIERWIYYEGRSRPTIKGFVFDDSKGRWLNDHWRIETSAVVHFDPVLGHVRTLNSTYILGEPANPS